MQGTSRPRAGQAHHRRNQRHEGNLDQAHSGDDEEEQDEENAWLHERLGRVMARSWHVPAWWLACLAWLRAAAPAFRFSPRSGPADRSADLVASPGAARDEGEQEATGRDVDVATPGGRAAVPDHLAPPHAGDERTDMEQQQQQPALGVGLQVALRTAMEDETKAAGPEGHQQSQQQQLEPVATASASSDEAHTGVEGAAGDVRTEGALRIVETEDQAYAQVSMTGRAGSERGGHGECACCRSVRLTAHRTAADLAARGLWVQCADETYCTIISAIEAVMKKTEDAKSNTSFAVRRRSLSVRVQRLASSHSRRL